MLYATNVACKLLDRRNGRCVDYSTGRSAYPTASGSTPTTWDARLAARDLRLSPARGGRTAAGMALSDLRQPRDGARGRAIDARLDGQRERCRGARISCGRASALRPRSRRGLPFPIDVRRLRTARRLRLRFDEAAGTLKLTCPWRTSRRAALAWALDQREWIEAQLARAGRPSRLSPAPSSRSKAARFELPGMKAHRAPRASRERSYAAAAPEQPSQPGSKHFSSDVRATSCRAISPNIPRQPA